MKFLFSDHDICTFTYHGKYLANSWIFAKFISLNSADYITSMEGISIQ